MRVPQEILDQILQVAVDTLPLRELFRARLVSGLFDEEITALLLKSPRLENEGFGYRDYSGKSVPGWRPFPRRLKCRYLQLKLEQHARAPCVFSIWMHKMIEGKDQRDLLIEKLLHAVASGEYTAEDLFCPEQVGPFMDRYGQFGYGADWEPLDTTFDILMVCSAIRRGDADELEVLLQQGQDLTRYSSRFHLMPLDIAAKRGSGDVVRVLLIYKCPLTFRFRHRDTDVLSVAARSGNKDGLDAWIGAMPKRLSHGVGYELGAAVRSVARIGNIDMVQFLLDRCDRHQQELRYNALIEAVEHGQDTTVEWLLDRGGFDPNIPTKEFPTHPVPAAVRCCEPGTRRPAIVKTLLKHGADPNGIYPGTTRTPLQKAMEMDYRETATLLVEHGADLNPWSHPASKDQRQAPILLLAARQRNHPLIKLLLDRGVDPVFHWRGKKYRLQLAHKQIEQVGRLFEDLGLQTEGEDDYILEQI